MYVIKLNGQFFAGYGTTMSQPLWIDDGPIFRATIFRVRKDAEAEAEVLARVWGYETLIEPLA